MKRKIIGIVIVIILILIFSILFIVSRQSKDVLIETITQDAISQLQSYSYYDNVVPDYSFDDMKTNIGLSNGIIEDFYSINPPVINTNQKFLTNRHLTYVTHDKDYLTYYVARGILQETLDNGKISRQNVEFIYKSGKYNPSTEVTDFVLVEKRILK